jgi:hypothetical protein
MEGKSNTITTVFFWLWIALLIPWLPFFLLSGMAFDGGYTAEAYVFFWSVASYPVTVIFAALMRKRMPASILLPLLSIGGVLMSSLLHSPRH